MTFHSYGRPLVVVENFKYLGRMLTDLDDDWPEGVDNLRKTLKWWARMSSILGREGADPRTSGNFYKVAVQATLLFGAELWVMSPWIGRILVSFHHRVNRCLSNMQPRRTGMGT